MRRDEEASKQAGKGFQRIDCHRGSRFIELGEVEPGLQDGLTAFLWVSVTTGIDQAWPVMGPTGDSIIHFDGKSIHILNYGEVILAYT